MTIRFIYLGWYSSWGFWKAENGLRVLDLWKLRFAFGKKPKQVNVYTANRRFERMLQGR